MSRRILTVSVRGHELFHSPLDNLGDGRAMAGLPYFAPDDRPYEANELVLGLRDSTDADTEWLTYLPPAEAGPTGLPSELRESYRKLMATAVDDGRLSVNYVTFPYAAVEAFERAVEAALRTGNGS